ncbi:MAG: autotransporter outer membrane beta-barrel domain-containing protein [Selenomonadaceae bacterium]|nr:autotransporter outer membrane beta-barrel domain-containing protein [Selenomonadaceae bacterium]
MLRKISKNIRKRIAKTLAAAFAIGCPMSASAMETYSIGWDGKQLFEVQYYGTDDKTDITTSFFKQDDDLSPAAILAYNLTPNMKAGLNKAFYWWAEILAPGAFVNQPAQYFVGNYTIPNAGAISISKLHGAETKNPNLFTEIFQNGRVVDRFANATDYMNKKALGSIAQEAYGLIHIGQNLGINEGDGEYGWINTYYYAFPIAQAMKSEDITPVMFHEIGHSLGLSADRRDNPYNLSFDGYEVFILGDGADNPNDYTSHLRDQFGRAPHSGVLILTQDIFNDATFRNNYRAATGKELTVDDAFIFDNLNGATGRNGRVGTYFVGDNVLEVLDGKTFTRFDGVQVSGIPINLWEGTPRFPEISHSELARSLMSHQRYRSYNSFLEAELALLQDIGYNIDRKNFYGRSIYNDGLTLTNEQGFSARANGQYVDGYNSSTMGVGLHVFGSNNIVTQRGNIWTNGYGATGIRVDGINDTIIVPQGTEIHSDGSLGTGVMVAYGKNNNVVINGTVTANGEDANAVHFEFGANAMGGTFEYRGSYLRYTRNINDWDGKLIGAQNRGLTEFTESNDDYSITDLVNGDLNAPMGSLTVNGKLESKNGRAIYIAEESFVDRIDINKGAQINGDIESVWKQFDWEDYGISDTFQTVTYQKAQYDNLGNIMDFETKTGEIEPLYIQYNGGNYVYTKYIPDLVTQLNFNAQDGAIFYNGNINGFDNMKMNVTSGTLNFGGAANVVNVNVFNGANLFGGTYTVNDMTARMADGFSDWTTGKFINHGKIGAMTINGDLLSDGILQGINGYSNGNIIVNGSAYVDGSTAQAVNMLPGETTSILAATNVTGNLRNATTATPVSGMLSNTGAIVGNTIQTTAHAANNLGEMNSTQAESYDAANEMNTMLIGDARREQLRPLYNLDAATTKVALEQIGTSNATKMMSYAQQRTLASRLIADRLSAKDFSDDVWIKFSKNWGKLYGGDKFHGQAISGGWDKQFSDKWRGGIFISYDATTLDNGNIYDTRGGLYGGFKSGADSAFIYVDGGQVRNKLHRSINPLGLGTSAKYHGKIFELGGEYKRDLTPDRSYHLSPFIGLQMSHLKQNGYSEHGAGIYNQHVRGKNNTYFAGQLGLEYRKDFERGNLAARIGIRHAFSGAEPELSFSYEGLKNSYTLRNRQDKTHFILSLSGENEFAKDWTFGGELYLQKGSHDRDLSASLFLRKVW